MSKRTRIAKSLHQKLNDLDDHLFIVREHLGKQGESTSRLKVLSAELRTLVCKSSGTEGLLWRLVDELKVDDEIFLHVPGDLIETHPLARGLSFLIVPIQRGGQGHPQLPPCNYSLKEIIKERQALVAGGKPFTHEYLIKAISQQMGSAHEDDGIEQMLVDIRSIFINGETPHVPVLITDSELTLEIGERVLEKAEASLNYKRPHHSHNYGNLSIVASLKISKVVLGRIFLFSFRSYVGNVNISVSAMPIGIEFAIEKNGRLVESLVSNLSKNILESSHSVFTFSYCSRTGEARTIVDGAASDLVKISELGWVHTSDLKLEMGKRANTEMLELFYILCYEKLLSSSHSKGLSELPPDGHGIWEYSEKLENRGAFPE